MSLSTPDHPCKSGGFYLHKKGDNHDIWPGNRTYAKTARIYDY